jgi:hypothetical protein
MPGVSSFDAIRNPELAKGVCHDSRCPDLSGTTLGAVRLLAIRGCKFLDGLNMSHSWPSSIKDVVTIAGKIKDGEASKAGSRFRVSENS